MPYDPKIHHRRSIRLGEYDYSTPGAYFLTVCTTSGAPDLGRIMDGCMRLNAAGGLVRDALDGLSRRSPGMVLDVSVVMPNHVHAVFLLTRAEGDSDASSGCDTKKAPTLAQVVRAFKSESAVRLNRMLERTGSFWQRNYYEHVIRNEKELDVVRRYVLENPARWECDRQNPEYAAPDMLREYSPGKPPEMPWEV
ncbi:MAG: transposase [Candidatus Hydrogenedentes bacterium]|nr:transposase [Candidatus Hydrogenedentota bacterium]